jgi:hypothetical protein
MLQPTAIAVGIDQLGKRSWPYQAIVMKMFEMVSKATVIIVAARNGSS